MNSALGAEKKIQWLLQSIILLLPAEKGSIPCRFLLELLRAVIFMDCGEMSNEELIKRIGQSLESASVSDLLVPAMTEQNATYEIAMVARLVKEFLTQDN